MSETMKKITAAVLTAVMTLSLGACGMIERNDPDPEETAVIGQGSESGQTLADSYAADDVFSVNCSVSGGYNPLSTTNTTNLMFLPLVYDTVFVVDEEFNVSSEIVTSVETDDYKWWVFKVDTGIVFHDGSNLTALDVAYSIQHAMSSKQYRDRLSVIYGCSAMDDETFAVSTASPRSQLPALLNIPVIKYGSMNEEWQPGTGPYMFDENMEKLVAFPQRHSAAPLPVDTIYLKDYSNLEDLVYAYKDSLIDIVVNDPTGMLNIGFGTASEVRYCNTTNMHYLGFNSSSTFFRYTVHRYGVTFAVDRERIVSKALGGCASASSIPISPASPLYNEEYGSYYSYSVQKAKNCFSNANVKDYDEDGFLEYMVTGIPLETEINFVVCADSSAKLEAATIVRENLEDLGFKVNLRTLTWDDYIEALCAGDFDMYYGEVKLTADFDLTALLAASGSANYAGILDEGYEQRISEYLGVSDADRAEKASALYKYIIETAPIIPICFEKRQILTHRGVVTGISATQYNVFNDIGNWTINTKD